ncbi:uncharacterized protein [Littorina saxatilis]|uniref:uncharacterized protein n=1 Tax=Littorina saxatilis TaxID=31220 RepID=UPI0038B61A96
MARFLIFFALVLAVSSQNDTQCSQTGADAEKLEDCITCNLFKKPKEVTIRVRNVLTEPNFEESLTVNCTRFKTLFYIMQEAAEANRFFRFTCKYYGKELGFFIEAFNDVFGNWAEKKTYWEILDGDLNQTPVGASNYVPKHGETVTFNLTQGGHEDI